MSGINVLKKDLTGRVTWQYDGVVLRQEDNSIVLEAFFNRPDMPFMGVVLKEDDRIVETFYSDRWYSIFEIYDRDDGALKGWYCNSGEPALVADGGVSYIDLALDLWVAADGRQTVLDEDEFEALTLDQATRQQAREALHALQQRFKIEHPPR